MLLVALMAPVGVDDAKPPKETEAARTARKAAALVLNEEGVKLAEKGDLEAALGRLAEALGKDPEEPTIRANAAKIHAAIGKKHFDERKFPEAAKEYHDAADLVPDELDYRHDEGVALAQGSQD